MNGGHVIVCVDYGKPFEVRADALADIACCPFCGSDDPRGAEEAGSR